MTDYMSRPDEQSQSQDLGLERSGVGITATVLPAEPGQRRDDLLRVRRELERLRRRSHVVGEVFARQPAQPADLASQPFVLGVEAPEQRRDPGGAGLDQDHLQAGELLEDAVDDEADEVGLHRLRPERVHLEVGACRASAGRGRIGPVVRARVDRDRPARLGRRLVDRMDDRMPEGLLGRVVDKQYLYHPRLVGDPADFLRRLVGELGRNDDRGDEPLIGV